MAAGEMFYTLPIYIQRFDEKLHAKIANKKSQFNLIVASWAAIQKKAQTLQFN